MAMTAIYSHIAVVMVQQILSIAGMRIMATCAGKLPVRIKRIFDSSYRVPFAEETGNDMGARGLLLVAVDTEISGLHP